MAPTPSVRIVKNIVHKGNTLLWSNRYHFNGGTPVDNTHWDTLFDNIVNAEKAVFNATEEIVHAYGYAAGSSVPVHDKAYTTNGTLVTGSDILMPSDVAALVRYSTTARTSKNHPIYLFNYYHTAYRDNAGTADTLSPAQKTALETYASAWISGFSDGSNTYVRSGPNGATATSRLVAGFLTHRDFRN